MRARVAILLIGLPLLHLAAIAQTGGPGESSSVPAKIGIVNLQLAITSTAEGKKAAADLQAQFDPRQAEIEDLQKQVDDVRGKLEKGQSSLSPDEKESLSADGARLQRVLQRKQQETQEDFNDAQQDAINRLGLKVVDILAKYAKINGYAAIIDNSAQGTPVVYASQGLDVTQDVVRLYDQSFPVKVGPTSGPRPTAPRPPASNQNP